MVKSNSNTFCFVRKSDLSQENYGATNCWTKQMKNFVGDSQNGSTYEMLYYFAGYL
jgi:hypothetical protein